MKKNIIKLVAIILCSIMIICMLPACGGKPDLMDLENPERADAFFDLVNENPGETYSVEMKMDITGSLYGVRLEAEMESETAYINYLGDSPTYHSEGKSTMTVGQDGAEVTQTTKSVSGYRDGKLYEMYDVDGVKTSLVSSVTVEEYRAHQEFLIGFTDEELTALHKSATLKDCERNEDGSWKATFSGYPEESLVSLIDYSFDSTVLILDGYKPKDIVFTFEADENFFPTDWEYVIVFEKTDSSNLYPEPHAKTMIEFDDIGTAEAPNVDLSSYTEVEALTDLQKIRHILGDMFNSDSGSFTSVNRQTVSSGTPISYTSEKDSIAYNTENGKYTFDIKANISQLGDQKGTDYVISYANGQMVFSGGGVNNQRQDMIESSAKAYIYSLMDPAGLSSASVSDIKLNDGEYTHSFEIIDPNYSALEASLSQLGATISDVKATVSVVYKDGKLTEYYYYLSLNCSVQGQNLTVKVESTVTYNTAADDEL